MLVVLSSFAGAGAGSSGWVLIPPTDHAPLDSKTVARELPLEIRSDSTARPMGDSSTNLSVTSFLASPSSVEVVEPSNISVATAGGVPPLTFVYDGLPYGCYSYNGSHFPCFPSETGHFEIRVRVSDAIGDVAYAMTNLTVTSGHGAPPKVLYFNATPSTVSVQKPTTISVTAVSQSSTPTAFLAYAFFDLPPGCASFNQTSLTCLPTQAGTYRVQVQVTDGFGSYVYASTTLTVVSTGSTGNVGSPLWIYPAAVGGVLIAAVAVVLLVRRPGPPSTGT